MFDREQGGVLNDTGSYCIASISEYIHSSISSIVVKVQLGFKVDVNDYIELVFESGQTAYLDIALNKIK